MSAAIRLHLLEQHVRDLLRAIDSGYFGKDFEVAGEESAFIEALRQAVRKPVPGGMDAAEAYERGRAIVRGGEVMPMKPCVCGKSAGATAMVTTCFTGTPEQWQVDFVRANVGKLVCFYCGGEVPATADYDHVTAGTVTERLRELGVI